MPIDNLDEQRRSIMGSLPARTSGEMQGFCHCVFPDIEHMQNEHYRWQRCRSCARPIKYSIIEQKAGVNIETGEVEFMDWVNELLETTPTEAAQLVAVEGWVEINRYIQSVEIENGIEEREIVVLAR